MKIQIQPFGYLGGGFKSQHQHGAFENKTGGFLVVLFSSFIPGEMIQFDYIYNIFEMGGSGINWYLAIFVQGKLPHQARQIDG